MLGEFFRIGHTAMQEAQEPCHRVLSLWYQRFANLCGRRPLRKIEKPESPKQVSRGEDVTKCKLGMPKNTLNLTCGRRFC